ncbi:hypothetical protein LUW75_18150 [Streptomyces sp. MRC013]|uniref:hypothetical protein n=1 Tax=Streptomyces sp. MRC013 TaxID=2898276 RepID=UPI002025FF7F|nr:hypothetical protein [Streptomyces sp. MRC013]URM91576.1 hypothetical protein LUW75_18150 [Streptomyces sp. MRC013]
MTAEEFHATMAAVHAHNIARITLLKNPDRKFEELPSYPVMFSAQETDLRSLPEAAQAVCRDRRDTEVKATEENKEVVSGWAGSRADHEQGKSGMSREEFQRRLKERHDKNIADFKAREDRTLERLSKLGDQYPEHRDLIVAAYQEVSAFFTRLWDAIKSFFENLVENILEFFRKVGKWFEDRWHDVEDWWRRTFG